MSFHGCRAMLRICRKSLKNYQTRLSFSCSSHKREVIPCSTHFTRLSHRSLVNVKGQDSSQLLQGLVTIDIPGLLPGASFYSMLLNVQGRVLYDIILYCHSCEHHVMECHSQVTTDLIKHLKKYAFRSKVDVSRDASTAVWAAYPGQAGDLSLANKVLSYLDPRVSSFGSRILAPSSYSASEVSSNLSLSPVEHYHRHRLEVGIAEGPDEIPVGSCFPLEYNLDFCNGISFNKGCYLGQELTARTHHTGVIRKRVMPVTLHGTLPDVVVPCGSKLTNNSGKNVGKLITHLGSTGLALLRVQEVGCRRLSFQAEELQDIHVTAHTPDWWPEAVSS